MEVHATEHAHCLIVNACKFKLHLVHLNTFTRRALIASLGTLSNLVILHCLVHSHASKEGQYIST